MYEKERVTAARGTWRYSLLLALSAWASTAAAQAPGAASPASAAPASAAKPAAPAAAGAAAGSSPAASAAAAPRPALATSSPAGAAKTKRKLPMRACPARVPEELNPPPDVTLEMVLPASGVQSYACAIDKPGEAPDWAPKGPHAMLGESNNLMGIHFGGPSWQAMDGSLVKGTKISSASAPDKSAIVWLLLSGTASGEGIFGKVTHIQRMDTVGGKPPQGGCDANHLETRVLVPYRTNYYFYRESEPGETVRQCRGTAKQAGEKASDKANKDKGGSVQTSTVKPASDKPSGDKPASKPTAEKGAEKAARNTAGKPSPEKAAKAAPEKGAAERSSGEKPAKPASD